MKKLELKNLKIKALSPEDKASIDGGLVPTLAVVGGPCGILIDRLTRIPDDPVGPCSSNEQ